MANIFERIKRVDQQHKDLIFGYFRKYHALLPQNNPYFCIQPLICFICLNYYNIPNQWDLTHINDTVKLEGDYVTVITEGDSTLLLENEISEGIHEYKFKVIKVSDPDDDFEEIEIGILPTTAIQEEDQDADLDEDEDEYEDEYREKKKYWKSYLFYDYGYCYCTSQGRTFGDRSGLNDDSYDGDNAYGCVVKKGDIITMIVDFDGNTLSYKVNDKHYGIAFHIEQNKYRVAVYLYAASTKIQLLQ